MEESAYICPWDECMEVVIFEDGSNYAICERCGSLCSRDGQDCCLMLEVGGLH